MANGDFPDLSSELLFEMTLQVAPATAVGATPLGRRYIAYVTGGTFEGPRLKGRVLPGGGDWVIQRPDMCSSLMCASHWKPTMEP